jgi:hypothetical protein
VSLEPKTKMLDDAQNSQVNKLTVEGPPMFNITTAMKTHSKFEYKSSSEMV